VQATLAHSKLTHKPRILVFEDVAMEHEGIGGRREWREADEEFRLPIEQSSAKYALVREIRTH